MKDQKDPNDQKDKFPGYPHYPAGEDITNKSNGVNRVDADPGDIAPDKRTLGTEQRSVHDQDEQAGDPSNEANVTQDDMELLDASSQNRDLDDPDVAASGLDATDEDGAPLNEATGDYGDTGADLDVPGSEDDDADEDMGEEDEENNYYSLGGDNHENLDDDNDI